MGILWERSDLNCRSELARDGLKGGAFIQQTRVIVNVHREQAHSYMTLGGRRFSVQGAARLIDINAVTPLAAMLARY
jgi:hypothetical protein